jgi:hypothetical protein
MTDSSLDTARLRSQLILIYDAYRTACLNEMYYKTELAFFEQWNLGISIAIALFATASPIAGWRMWETGSSFRLAWAILAGLGAVLSVISPLLKLSDKIKNLSELRTGYSLLYFDLGEIVGNISQNYTVQPADNELFLAAKKRMRELTVKENVLPSSAQVRFLQKKVNNLLPPEKFWMPEGVIYAERTAARTP